MSSNVPTLKPCGVCQRPIAEQVAETDLGRVTFIVCPFCDRRKCKTCGYPDITGKASRCTACGDSLLRH